MHAERFTFFHDGPFSQWYPCSFTVEQLGFTHAEQYMMYAKAVLFGDTATAEQILAAKTPRLQKQLGRRVANFDEQVWVMFREGIVYTGNYAKFSQNADLLKLLLQTRGTTLVEASPRDKIWGIGLAEDDPRAHDRTQWRGLNLLGQTLTRVREALAWELGVAGSADLAQTNRPAPASPAPAAKANRP